MSSSKTYILFYLWSGIFLSRGINLIFNKTYKEAYMDEYCKKLSKKYTVKNKEGLTKLRANIHIIEGLSFILFGYLYKHNMENFLIFSMIIVAIETFSYKRKLNYLQVKSKDIN
ncbi:hypothetical protein R9X47_25750 [Wukongibacter baidiensis]|uniref:hypothetical protein n=1 Tax=Wukongibacter baidiensis TaxID=1723361 RepID=UPI003D8001A1